jgi:Uma2 family endonuclease
MEVNEPELNYSKKKYTVEEYREMESTSEVKHEYYQGEIFAMAGATVPHNFVRKNIISALDQKLSDSPCQPHNGDTRIYIKKNGMHMYPDVTIICGEVRTDNNDKFNVLNPTIILEVLSPSTEGYDKGLKFSFYREIPTLKEYILVEPESVRIEAFHLNADGFWGLKVYKDIESSLELPSINVSLPLKEIYKRTDLIEQLENKK